jgi:hypothetical protein
MSREDHRLPEVIVQENEYASPGYAYWATLGPYRMGCTVGAGFTKSEAIEDLFEQLDDER